MKSKNNTVKKSKLTKTAKAALPLFALFGGQGFASSRNPLSLQSSRKLAGKSVVYINDVDAPAIPTLGAKVAQQVKSPFAAFTNKSVAQTKNAQLDIKSQAMAFLNENNLLSSDATMKSNISGNTISRKTFSDDWQWSTRLSGPLPPTTNTQAAASFCTSAATYSGVAMGRFAAQFNATVYNSYTCFALDLASSNIVYQYAPSGAGILPFCQAVHQACDGQMLPVELINFEVE